MRVGFHITGAVADRAARLTLGERSLEVLGLWNTPSIRPSDPRVRSLDQLDDVTVIVTDSPEPADVLEAALAAGIGCVLAAEAVTATGVEDRFRQAGLPLLMGANLSAGIAAGLAGHRANRVGERIEITVAWTCPGTPHRHGESIPFPAPVSARWARPDRHSQWPDPGVITRRFEAPVQGTWAAAMTSVAEADSDGLRTDILGVADDATHLDAIALATAAALVGRGEVPAGPHWVSEVPVAFIETALAIGLEVATYHPASETQTDN